VYPVRIPIQALQSRGNDIRDMLGPIAAASHAGGPAWQPRSGSSEFVIGTHDGSPSGSDYREWTFATIRPDVRAQYYERWLKFEDRGREQWYLERAYLHFYKVKPASRELLEFLCLHCDPAAAAGESENETQRVRLEKQAHYKRHPHLHVIAAETPFPHAHIALQVGFLDAVLASTESLTKAIGYAVQLIRDEILDAMD